ncbi:methyl-accepting chemotaxis protein [Sphingomonas sp. RB3P16]|uniref:methyl-accepting chemotaxis protein n=1 Tax=Parasphingomonas frigoris TaxID=3096163 RepID=UPI002FCA2B01
MISFSRVSIGPKLLGIAGILIASLLLVGFTVVIIEARRTASSLSQGLAEAQADALAKQLVGDIGVVDATVRSMVESLSTLHQSGVRDRDIAMSVLKPNVEASPLALASWFLEEPLGFDGKAAPGHLGSRPNGAFMPYWIKRDGQIKMEPNMDPGLYSADYYKLSRNSGKAALTEPYPYETGGKTITMTSLTYPVVSSGRTIGVAGIDIALGDITARLGKMHPFGTGRVMLLSRSALWVAHPDAAARMKPYADAGADEVKQALATGETKLIALPGVGGGVIRIISPINLPTLNTTWAVVTDVPAAALTAPAARLGWELILVGLLVLGTVIVGLFFAVRAVVGRPISALSLAVDGLAKGESRSIPYLDRPDEIETLARAADVFRQASADRAASDARSAAEQKQVVATVSDHLEALAEGDLTKTISAEFPPAYDALKSNFNQALSALRGLIASVMESAASIRTGSNEIAQASEDLARRTEGNAASLEETSAALVQIDTRLRATALSSSQTVSRADQAIATVGSGRATADEAVEAMVRVSDSAKGIDSVIEGLDKIAFQTRVLAMNAAVEAGRAGDAGRGFAVVADLVSALAMRAEEEAKRARDQLTVTQTEVGTAVQAVQKVDGALATISGDVDEVHKLLGTMAADAIAQSSAISQITAAISAMDQSTQQNAAMVEETSAAARNLTTEVISLAEQTEMFQTQEVKTARRALPEKIVAALSAPDISRKNPAPVYRSPVKMLSTAGGEPDDWNTF